MIHVAIGQDSHRFEADPSQKPLMLGGVLIEKINGLEGNSDADVVLHAVTNAVSGISTVNILGEISDDLCLNKGITDSSVYLEEALKHLGDARIIHLSISIECSRPKITPHIIRMRTRLSELLSIEPKHIGITATTGEGLTAFGRGEGIFCTVLLTVSDSY
jgi:2-C-methyl-D-erythritol 2,4-cyclodiphosphate synthase